jgi:hypothetical protein
VSVAGDGLLVFDANRMRRQTDRHVRAVIAQQLGREYRNVAGWSRRVGVIRLGLSSSMHEEEQIDALVESWGFDAKSVRTWYGHRPGPPDARRYPTEALTRLMDDLRWKATARPERRRGIRGFARRVRRLLAEAEAGRSPGGAAAGCEPHKTGDHVGSNVGYNPERHNGNCFLNDPGTANKGTKPKPRGKKASTGHQGGFAGRPQGKGAVERQKAIDVEYTVKEASHLESADTSSVESIARTLRQVVERGEAAGVTYPVGLEAAVATLFGARLKSLGKGFDAIGEFAGFAILLDAKYSESILGYQESLPTKRHKIGEYQATRRIRLYIVMVPGRGLYLHVGIDSETSPAFEGEKGGATKRGLVHPEALARHIDGSGRPLPFVLLSDRFKSLEEMKSATPGDVDAIHQATIRTLKGMKSKMKKLHQHIDAQAQRATDKAVEPLIQAYPELVARKALKALGHTPEQIEAALKLGTNKGKRRRSD